MINNGTIHLTDVAGPSKTAKLLTRTDYETIVPSVGIQTQLIIPDTSARPWTIKSLN